MTEEKVYSNLCFYYDYRNPYNQMTNDELEEARERVHLKEVIKNCKCDNCYYGRTELALYILHLEDQLDSLPID